MEAKIGLAGILTDDLNILPSQFRADAGSEGFAEGFFGRETGGEMDVSVSLAQTIILLGLKEKAIQKPLTKLVQGFFEAMAGNQVDSVA